jgi:macrolide transport system ATP-binding/permease protein
MNAPPIQHHLQGLTQRPRRFVRGCAWLVPAARRADWRRQWDADLAAQAAFLLEQGHTPAAIQRDLTRRSLGAASHAIWFRTHHWRTLMTLQDLRHAWRSLAQRPGVTVAIVLTLGLAIGANTTIFSWVDALVLSPLPGTQRPAELVVLKFATATRDDLSFSYPNYRDVRDSQPGGLTGIAVKDMLAVSLRVGTNAPERIWIEVVSGNIFDVLGVRTALGRPLQTGDETDRQPVAVISDALWRTRFNSDPDIVGRPLTLNGHAVSVVGVTHPDFRGAMGGLTMEAWVPVTMHGVLTGRDLVESRGSGWLMAIGRLAPGASQAEAQASLRVVADRLAADHPVNEGRTLRVGSINEDGVAEVLLPVVTVVMSVVALVLLIACANVSGLLLARAISRQHELSIRTALGASRWRLARQLLLESFLLAGLGGVAGVMMAIWTSRGLDALLPPLPYPVFIGASLNGRVLAFSAGVTVLATIVFGLAPALQGSRTQLQGAIRGTRAETGTRGRSRLRRALVVSQVALAMVLLISAGLFVRTLSNAYDVDPGFSRRNAVLASFDLSSLGLDETKGRALLDELITRSEAIPGVVSASVSTLVPLSVGGGSDTDPDIDGYTPAEHEEVVVYYGMVGPGYFDTMGVPLVAGRAIDERDRATGAQVVVINETMARRYWPGRDALGGRVRASQEWATVIGVAKDGKYGTLSEDPRSVMYFPIQQIYRADPVLHVATSGPAESTIAAVRTLVSSLAPDLALYDVRTLEEHLRMSVAVPRMAALLLGIFGALALALAGIGLYGVVAFSVGQRTQEIGVRMALGADRGVILREVLGQGAWLTGVGLVIGLGVAMVAMPLLSSLLVNVSPTDITTFATTGLLLLAVSLLAAWIPARRAATVNPVEALRH